MKDKEETEVWAEGLSVKIVKVWGDSGNREVWYIVDPGRYRVQVLHPMPPLSLLLD
jgi:hypothetical protein